MKNYFFIGLIFTSCANLYSMDDCFSTKFLKVRQDTWPIRKQLDDIDKHLFRKRPILTTEQFTKFKSQHDTIITYLDNVVKQCDHANMDLFGQKFTKLDKYFGEAQAYLRLASEELGYYKEILKEALKIDFNAKSAL